MKNSEKFGRGNFKANYGIMNQNEDVMLKIHTPWYEYYKEVEDLINNNF